MLGPDDLAEIEGDAAACWGHAGADPGGVSLNELCVRTVGTPPRFEPLRQLGTLATVGTEEFAFVRRGLPKTRARHVLGHEIGHWWRRHTGRPNRGSYVEAWCDAFGAALIAPRAAVIAARRLDGDDPVLLAKRLRVTQSVALLRLGEVTGAPVAVVRPHGALVRGEDWGWPYLTYSAAKAARWPGVRRVQLAEELAVPRVGLRAKAG